MRDINKVKESELKDIYVFCDKLDRLDALMQELVMSKSYDKKLELCKRILVEIEKIDINNTPDTVENMPVLTFCEGNPKYPMLDGVKLRAVKKYDLEAEARGSGYNTFVLRLEMEVQVPEEEEKHGIDKWS